ncbi:MAG: Fe-S-cluster containining protein [Myxococcota bacterium]|jgi:Fe-S-cluster containining protein
MPTLVPALRVGVAVEPAPQDSSFPAVLIDTELERRMKLDWTVLAVAERLSEGPSDLTELVEITEADPEVVEQAVALLQRMHVLDTEATRAFVADARAVRERQTAEPSTVPLLIRADAAFSCTMCGSCCGGHNVGPVSDEVLEGLAPYQQMLRDVTGSAKGLFFEVPTPTPQGDVHYKAVCHTSGGSCVFLGDDHKCVIHARLGGEKKPAVCRLFPYQFTATPDGVAVSLQMECRGFVEAGQGKPLTEQEPELRRLLAMAPVPRVRPVIALERGVALSWAEYSALEARLHEQLDAHPADPSQALLAMRGVLEEAAGRTPAVQVQEKADAQEKAEEHSGRDALARDMDALTEALIEANDTLRDAFAQDDERTIVHTESLDQLSLAFRDLRARFARSARKPRRADQARLFVQATHHHLHGKDLTHSSRLTLGMARVAFGWFVAQTLAQSRARQVKRAHLVPQDILDAMTVVNFMLRNSDFVRSFQRFDAAVESLFYHRLPGLVACAEGLAEPDVRLELTKF